MVPQPNAAAADVVGRLGVSEYAAEYKGPAGLAAAVRATAGEPSLAAGRSARSAKLSQRSARKEWSPDVALDPRTVEAADALCATAARLASLPAWGSPGASRRGVSPASRAKKKADAVEAQEYLCTRWEAWAQSIARALEEGTALPPPPLPTSGALGVSATLLRILQASAFAAAALARSFTEAESWKHEVETLDMALARSRAHAEQLEDTIESLQEDRNNHRDSGKNLHETVQSLQQMNAAQREQLRQVQEELDEERDRRIEAERRLETACPNCARNAQVVEDLQDELDRVQALQSDELTETRQQAAEATRLARIAETERRELSEVLRRLASTESSNGFKPAVLSPVAALPRTSRASSPYLSRSHTSPMESLRSLKGGAVGTENQRLTSGVSRERLAR
mmetsp:Transcript_48840/g.116113  ORF Transcript_48840/g.116113 Transcript_48840/m.116113 type:complete len:398 (+) Transcript_48840:66-1259(+)